MPSNDIRLNRRFARLREALVRTGLVVPPTRGR